MKYIALFLLPLATVLALPGAQIVKNSQAQPNGNAARLEQRQSNSNTECNLLDTLELTSLSTECIWSRNTVSTGSGGLTGFNECFKDTDGENCCSLVDGTTFCDVCVKSDSQLAGCSAGFPASSKERRDAEAEPSLDLGPPNNCFTHVVEARGFKGTVPVCDNDLLDDLELGIVYTR